MSNLDVSLLEYLRSENPVLNGNMCQGKGNTSSKTWSWITPRAIEVWEDFNLDSLDKIYDGQLKEVLECHFPLRDFSAIPEYPFCEIHDESSLDVLIAKWNQSMITDALSSAQIFLAHRLNHGRIYMVRGGQTDDLAPAKKLRPDWGGVKWYRGNTRKPRNVLPGDTKLSYKWSSADITLGPTKIHPKNADWLRPLTQVFSYCVRSDSRYGYLITDKELVVLRIRPGSLTKIQATVKTMGSSKVPNLTPAAQARLTGILEFQAIPWQSKNRVLRSQRSGMTVNLALWWLHMLAAEDSAIREQYAPLSRAVRTIQAKTDVKTDVEAKTKAEAEAEADTEGEKPTCSFTVSDMSAVGHRLSNVDLESPGDKPTRKSNRQGQKRTREDNVGQVNRNGKKPRS